MNTCNQTNLYDVLDQFLISSKCKNKYQYIVSNGIGNF